MSNGSNSLIQMLLSAEAEADSIVKTARENRVKKLKEAIESAESEIAILREKEEKVFQEQARERHGHEDTSVADLDELTKKEMVILQTRFQAQREKSVSFLLDRVLAVKLALSPSQCRSLISSNAPTRK